MAVRGIHTSVFLVELSSILWLVVSGLVGRRDRSVAVAAGLVAIEAGVFVANAGVCPLTPLTERLGASRGSVSDIFLPGPVARTIPVWSSALVVLAMALHARSAVARRPRIPQPRPTPSSDATGLTYGIRTIRNEVTRPRSPAMSGTSSATCSEIGRASVLIRMISASYRRRLARRSAASSAVLLMTCGVVLERRGDQLLLGRGQDDALLGQLRERERERREHDRRRRTRARTTGRTSRARS